MEPNDNEPQIEVVDVRELALILRVEMDGTVKIAGRMPKAEIVRVLHQIAVDFEARTT